MDVVSLIVAYAPLGAWKANDNDLNAALISVAISMSMVSVVIKVCPK